MLMPKRVKRRKQFRGTMKGKALRGNKINYGEFGIVATEPAWIKSNQIEAARVQVDVENAKYNIAETCVDSVSMDELFELFVLRQLGISHQPIIILNTDEYYNKVTELLREATSRSDVIDILNDIIEYPTETAFQGLDFLDSERENELILKYFMLLLTEQVLLNF